MRTREADLLALAVKAAEEHPDATALLVDLSHVPHIDDPAFFRVLVGRLQERARQLDAQRFDLADHRICFVVRTSDAATLETAVKSLSSLLVAHGKPPIQETRFALQTRPEPFLTACREMAKAVENRPDFRAEDDDGRALAAFLAIERNLAAADISNLLREQAIVDLSDPAAPSILAIEIFTSIQAVQTLYGIPLTRNPWLFDRVTEILDRRMLLHLSRDRAQTDRRLSINIHLSTVLSDSFETFLLDQRFDWRRHLIFELSHIEMIDAPDRFAAALRRFTDLEATVAVDAVPWTSLAHMAEASSDIRFIKVEWAPDLASLDGDARTRLTEMLDRIGRDRIVLHHCPDEAAIETALALGIHLVQGWGVDARLSHPVAAEKPTTTAPHGRKPRSQRR
ncbi:EAL domain-containing protein [Thalassobaculum salexigens]|uniref:EAL domain-containing protein n=1 Tax=Thalassobaculum salexigens TaxID=455360 RepID=UPI00040B5DA8|nr:EAL domain-containing protein [Thalassobaculum salexigens]